MKRSYGSENPYGLAATHRQTPITPTNPNPGQPPLGDPSQQAYSPYTPGQQTFQVPQRQPTYPMYQPPLPVSAPPPAPPVPEVNPDLYRNYGYGQQRMPPQNMPRSPYPPAPMPYYQQQPPAGPPAHPGYYPPPQPGYYQQPPPVPTSMLSPMSDSHLHKKPRYDMPPAALPPLGSMRPPARFDPGPPVPGMPARPIPSTLPPMRFDGPPRPVIPPTERGAKITAAPMRGYTIDDEQRRQANLPPTPMRERHDPPERERERDRDRDRERNTGQSRGGGRRPAARSSLPPRAPEYRAPRSRDKGDHDSNRRDKDARRTLTDFRIIGLEIPEIGWSWKADSPNEAQVNGAPAKHKLDEDGEADSNAKKLKAENGAAGQAAPLPEGSVQTAAQAEEAKTGEAVANGTDSPRLPQPENAENVAEPAKEKAASPAVDPKQAWMARENSRLRIYFASPVADPLVGALKESGRRTAPTPTLPTQATLSPKIDTATAQPNAEIDGEPSVKTEEDSLDAANVAEQLTQSTPVPGAQEEQADMSLDSVKIKEEVDGVEIKEEVPTDDAIPPDPAPDRISISYAKNRRRMVVDAETISKVTIHRAQGRIELSLNLSLATAPSRDGSNKADTYRLFQGLLIEALDETADEFYIVDRQALIEPLREEDALQPSLRQLLAQSNGESVSLGEDKTLTIIAHLDKVNPLTEARWVRSSEPNAWAFAPVSASKGASSSLADSAWAHKLHIVDPEPPPTFKDVMKTWVEQRPETQKESLQTFVDEQFSEVNNVVELMLCLIRGGDLPQNRKDHGTPHRSALSTEIGARATRMGAPCPTEQTSLSLATFAMFQLALNNGKRAGLDTTELESQVSEIVRQIPPVMLYKAVDVQFRAWTDKRKTEK